MLNIYCVEDEPQILELISLLIEGLNCHLTVFEDPKLALEAINKVPPDLLLVDYRLPGLTGVELSKSISRTIPKILITGELDLELDCDFYAVFIKPFDLNLLKNIITKFIEERKS